MPPRLVGYQSWLYQMPCIGSQGNVFVSVPVPWHADLPDEPANRWLIACGDLTGRGEISACLKEALKGEIIDLLDAMSDPASILKALHRNLAELAWDCYFATLVVAVIDGGLHELTIANAGRIPPLLRHVDRRVVPIGEEAVGIPLWIVAKQSYGNVTVPFGPGDVVTFHSDGVIAVADHRDHLFDLDRLRRTIAQAGEGATSIEQSILEALHRFRGGRAQAEDITLLCLERTVATTLRG
jgi:serine phosphatase RsbU (regulator of sigma subunit)